MLQLQGKVTMHCSFFLTAVCVYDIFGILMSLGYQYQCLNDYVSTITCSLNITEFPSNVSAYRLEFSSFSNHNCTLILREESLVCVLDLSPLIFNDADSYNISLLAGNHGNSISVVLDGDYEPKEYIRPLAPCNLSIVWDKDGAVVQWQTGYDPERLIIEHLQYQLRIDGNSETYLAHVMDQKMFVEMSKFKPYTNYTMRVHAQPNQKHYKGVWSEWSPPLYWSSAVTHHDSSESLFLMNLYIVLLTISLVLLLFIAYSRCRKQEYVPSPAPYFRDWNRDAQIHSLLPGKVRNVIQVEEDLQIDIVTEHEDTPPEQTSIDDAMMGMTNEHKATHPQSPAGSEVDSGCWIRDVMTTERGSITCSEDYCTLSYSLNTKHSA